MRRCGPIGFARWIATDTFASFPAFLGVGLVLRLVLSQARPDKGQYRADRAGVLARPSWGWSTGSSPHDGRPEACTEVPVTAPAVTYRSVLVRRRGGLDAVAVVDRPRTPPGSGELLVRVLTAPVCQDDVAIRRGNRPFLRRPPFVPGYAFIGEVAELGTGVTDLEVGDRVTALTRFDSHAQYVTWPAAEVAPVPPDVDPVAAAAIPLNYLVAHQVLHRVAKVRPGQTALVVGASGGVGTALLDLARHAGLRTYGTASPAKHQVVTGFGATPIDYHDTDLVATLGAAEPAGLDYVFNGMGPEYLTPGLALLRRGGHLVAYGAPQSLPDLARLLGRLVATNVLPTGKTITGYGTHRQGVATFQQDWATLFSLLRDGHIHPVIHATYPLEDAVCAYQDLESGTVTGTVVLIAAPFPADDTQG